MVAITTLIKDGEVAGNILGQKSASRAVDITNFAMVCLSELAIKGLLPTFAQQCSEVLFAAPSVLPTSWMTALTSDGTDAIKCIPALGSSVAPSAPCVFPSNVVPVNVNLDNANALAFEMADLSVSSGTFCILSQSTAAPLGISIQGSNAAAPLTCGTLASSDCNDANACICVQVDFAYGENATNTLSSHALLRPAAANYPAACGTGANVLLACTNGTAGAMTPLTETGFTPPTGADASCYNKMIAVISAGACGDDADFIAMSGIC